MTNDVAEHTIQIVAIGRKNWTFADSDDGGRTASLICKLIEKVKLNGDDLEANLRAGFGRVSQYPLPPAPRAATLRDHAELAAADNSERLGVSSNSIHNGLALPNLRTSQWRSQRHHGCYSQGQSNRQRSR